MGLKIAFCGPDRTLNSELANFALGHIQGPSHLLEDPMDIIAIRTGKTDFEDQEVDWMNLWSTVSRRMMIEGTDQDKGLIVSASCGIDEVCAQAARLGELMEQQQLGMTLVGADGEPLLGEEGVWINRSGAVLQTILNSTEEEVFGYWNHVYALVPDDREDPLNLQYHDFLSTVPAFQGVVKLPYGLDIATSVLEIEAEKWQTSPD